MAGRRANHALALGALVLVAWFAVLARDEWVGRAGADRVLNSPMMSDADWRRSLDQMRAARFLNPGSQWDVTRATALVLRDRRAALRIAEDVVAREPDNLQAWNVVLRTRTLLGDPRARLAAREVRRLNPLASQP